jgi:hypothetical protein
MLRVVRGEPSDEELAALTVALALVNTAAHEPPARASAWLGPAYQLRSPLHPGTGAWRASALPSRKG